MFCRRERMSDMRTAGGFLAGCLVGMVVGAAVGILLAPDSGQGTRSRVARRAGQTRDQVLEAMEGLIGRREPGQPPCEAEAEA